MLLASRIALVPTGTELTAVLVVVCFSAGLNVYATVAMLGLLARANLLALPGSLHGVENWYVIGVCCLLFLVELVGDKIPIFDLLWNALHTFIRVPVAGLIVYQATKQLSPEHQFLATLLGAAIALAAHGGKTAVRAAVTPSPEPFSNITLSLGEDALALGLTWLATRHPYAAGLIAAIMVAVIVTMIHFVSRSLRALFRGAEQDFER